MIYAAIEIWHHEVIHISLAGIYYSTFIGAITSALIYVLWYILMKELRGVTSAVIQMLVPVIVAISSAPLLVEQITTRLILAGATMLTGILLVTISKTNIAK
ncbi:EamA family transporter [Acidithiobacillus ferrianus]|uniref:EamA family transporter n=1 Tax=Acidithiobacillus ferrianus TaxID=2678518 RepID=UPI0013CF7937